MIRHNGTSMGAHRASWIMTFGAIPKETPWVLHKCDVPLCVNPDHLFLGTLRDNLLDMISKDRHPWIKRLVK